MTPYDEEERADFYSRLEPATAALKQALENFAAAQMCSDYQEARRLVDMTMDVLRDFVQQSRPPGPPSL